MSGICISQVEFCISCENNNFLVEKKYNCCASKNIYIAEGEKPISWNKRRKGRIIDFAFFYVCGALMWLRIVEFLRKEIGNQQFISFILLMKVR